MYLYNLLCKYFNDNKPLLNYYDISKAEIIYIVDKIKDSFKHARDGKPLYYIDNTDKIKINNYY